MVQGKGGEGVPSEEVLEQVMSCCVVGVYIGITTNVYWNNRLWYIKTMSRVVRAVRKSGSLPLVGR